jgi:hypothetical protein
METYLISSSEGDIVGACSLPIFFATRATCLLTEIVELLDSKKWSSFSSALPLNALLTWEQIVAD